MEKQNRGSIGLAILWMFLISLLLCWLPLAGPLIAGIVGGRTAGSIGRGFLAAIIPVVALGLWVFFFTTLLTSVPVIGMLASVGLVVMLLLYELPLLLGVVVGGLLGGVATPAERPGAS